MNNNNKGITYIGADMSLAGDMSIRGPAMIAGKTKGKISSSHQIQIAVGGEVEGEVFCQEMRVSGVFKGKLHCNKLVIVSSGVVDGEVSSHQMEIYDGGQFIGMRTKGPDASILPEPEAGSTAINMPAMTDSNKSASSPKWAYAALAGAVIVAGILFLPQINSFIMSPNISPDPVANQASQYLQSSNDITEDDAALLMQDVEQQSAFLEQREELIGAGQTDINTAMEDLHALEHTNQALGDTLNTDGTNEPDIELIP